MNIFISQVFDDTPRHTMWETILEMLPSCGSLYVVKCRVIKITFTLGHFNRTFCETCSKFIIGYNNCQMSCVLTFPTLFSYLVILIDNPCKIPCLGWIQLFVSTFIKYLFSSLFFFFPFFFFFFFSFFFFFFFWGVGGRL